MKKLLGLMMAVCLLMGCGSVLPEVMAPSGLDGVPDIRNFPQDQRLELDAAFGEVMFAVYRHGETVDWLDGNDPLVIRLLGFLEYSCNQGLDVKAPETASIYDLEHYEQISQRCLHVYFQNPPGGDAAICSAPEILVDGDHYFVYNGYRELGTEGQQTVPLAGVAAAEMYHPYGIEDEDLLTFAGFPE